MSGFLTPLVLEYVEPWRYNTPEIWSDNDGTARWRVATRFDYHSSLLEQIVSVDPGFYTDLASVPVLPVMYSLFGGRYARPAVVHDYLCRQGYLRRETCDKVFLEAMRLENALELATMNDSGADRDSVAERAAELEGQTYSMYVGVRLYSASGAWIMDTDSGFG